MENEDQDKNKLEQNAIDDHDRSQFARSSGWKLVKTRLLEKMIETDSASATIEREVRKGTPLDDILKILYTNGKAVNMVAEWINQIEAIGGLANADIKQEMREGKAEEIITRLPET